MIKVTFKPTIDFHERAERVYEEQKHTIRSLIPWADIHHIGSTTIPGSVTKGDLDINVRVSDENFESSVKKLKEVYQINQPANWTSNFASFKDDNNFDIPVGVQLTKIDSESDDFVKLKDLLVNDKDLLEEYNQMKLKYEGKDMNEYRKAKAEFFEKLRKHLK